MEFRHPHFHGVKVTSYWIFNPVKEEVSGGSIRRKYPEDVSGGSIQYPEGVSRGSNRRMYTDQWNSFDHVNELTLVCAKLCLNLPGQLKNQFLQKWKKSICGQPMQKMFKIISCVIKTFNTLCIKNKISIKGKIKILVSVQKY